MILYHGSTMEVSQPRILKSEIGRDFGFSFYTTDIQAQAERWAKRRAMIERRRTKTKVQAIVSVYEWDENAAKQLQFLQFDGASMDWLELVVTCRNFMTVHDGCNPMTADFPDIRNPVSVNFLSVCFLQTFADRM